MNISIVILNYNGLKETIQCLESVKKLETDNFKITLIVIDNNSKDNSKKIFSKMNNIVFIANESNLGYSGGNNIGIKKALQLKADYIVILNNDTIVDKCLITNLLKGTKIADIVSPKIYFAAGFEYHKSRYKKQDLGKIIWYAGGKIDRQNVLGIHIGVDEVDKGQFSKEKEIEFITGACFMASKSVFEKIGFFDEKYFLYLEDMDFSVRAKKAGFRMLFEPTAIIWHKNAKSSGGSGSPIQDYFITRNRMLFAFKHLSLRTNFALFRQAIKNLQYKTKRKAFFDFMFCNFGIGNQNL